MVPCFVLLFIEFFFLNGSMDGRVDVYLHHGGRWIMDLVLHYVGGNVHIVEDFDVDFLSIINVKDVYK